MRRDLNWLKILALLPIPLFIASIIALAYSNPSVVFEPPYLLPILNILFLSIISFVIAYLAWRSYMATGAVSLLLSGCGMVAFGLGSLIAGFIIDSPNGINLTPTIHNTGALLGAIFLTLSSLYALLKPTPYKSPRHGRLYLGFSYLAILLFMVLFTLAALAGLIPPFFVQGSGPTVLRQVVLGTATILFAVSALIFLRVYFRSKSDFTYWLSLALALITIGLCAIFLQKSVGSPMGWSGRIAQYLGCFYILVGVISVVSSAHKKQVPLENEFVRSFNYIEANFKTLVQMAPNAVISCDDKNRILSWNPAATKIFEYDEKEAIGADLLALILPPENSLLIASRMKELSVQKRKSAMSEERVETTATNKSGNSIPTEFSIAASEISGEWIWTFIIRDITERIKAEKIRHNIQTMLARTEGIANVGSWEWDIATDTVTWSDELFHIFQLDPKEGAPSFTQHPAFYHPGDMTRLQQAVEIAVTKGTPYELELRAIRKDGQTRFCVARGVAEMGPTGKPIRLVGSLQDITERKQNENALVDSESKYRYLVETAGVGFTSVDLEGKITFANKALCQMLGYASDEVLGRSLMDFLYQDDMPDMLAKFSDVVQTGQISISNYEFRLLHKSGNILWVGASPSLLFREGHPCGFMAVLGDITERKKAEEDLRESEGKYRLVVDSSAEIIYISQDGILKFVNRAAGKVSGYSDEELINRPFSEMVHPEDREMALGHHFARLRGEEVLTPYECRIITKSKDVRWLEIKSTNFIWAEKPAMLSLASDITERKQAEDERETAFNSLKRTFQAMIDTMVSVVEMRDPYTAGHQRRVADLTGAIAREMNLDDSKIEHLIMAARIHDIGKMYVPSEILSKPGKLNDIEFSLIKTHPLSSYNIIKDIEFSQPVALMALQHHERLDGSGYPNGLKGEEILTESKILAVADVVEAMASHRPYRPALGVDKALDEILKNKGKLYDPDVVDACVELINENGFKFED